MPCLFSFTHGIAFRTKGRSAFGCYSSVQCILVSLIDAFLLYYKENKYNYSFLSKTQVIIFNLKGETIS